MKKISFLFFIIFIIFLFFSCPSEIVKKTNWRGELKSDFDTPNTYKNKHEIEFFMRNDSTMRLILERKEVDSDVSEFTFDGTYILNSNYTFEATLEDEDEDLKIKLEGILNTFNSNGYGDFKLKVLDIVEYDGEWEVSRFY